MPRPGLDAALAAAHGQVVAGDPEQPGRRRHLPSRPEAVRAHESGRECLGGQIGRDLRVADTCQEVAEHAVLVAAIEHAEGTWLAASPSEQLLVRRVVPHRCHTHTLHFARSL
jgi:hypothetical protein